MKRVLSPFLICFIIIAGCSNNEKENKETTPEISQNGSDSLALNSFLFVGKWYGNVGIFNYDIASKKTAVVWWKTTETVITLNYKPGGNPSFFLTAKRYGKKGSYPFINRMRLYRINEGITNSEKIADLGDGIQLAAHWNDVGNLEVLFTKVDEKIASYVNRYKKVYNTFGKLIDDEIETYDIEKSGFPRLLPRQSETVSASGKYGVAVINDTVYLKVAGEHDLKFVTPVVHNFNRSAWNDKEDYFFISTIDLQDESIKTNDPETSALYIYSIQGDSVTVSWHGGGIKNFFVYNDFIIFDDGFDRNSSINIYNFRLNKLYANIKMYGGCGLVNVPEVSR